MEILLALKMGNCLDLVMAFSDIQKQRDKIPSESRVNNMAFRFLLVHNGAELQARTTSEASGVRK